LLLLQAQKTEFFTLQHRFLFNRIRRATQRGVRRDLTRVTKAELCDTLFIIFSARRLEFLKREATAAADTPFLACNNNGGADGGVKNKITFTPRG
jgi:hypothetical protein